MWRCKLQLEIMVSLAHWNPEKLSIYVLVASISGEISFTLINFFIGPLWLTSHSEGARKATFVHAVGCRYIHFLCMGL